MENPAARGSKPLLKSTDRYCFAVAKAATGHDFTWLAERFGEHFYVQWKKCKDQFARSGGKGELGSLESVVSSAVIACNHENGYWPVRFVANQGAFDILHAQFPLGTVCRTGQLTDPILATAVVFKANSKICEYIRDTQGTIVSRYVYRAVGNDSKAAMAFVTSGMFASGVSAATPKADYYAFTEVKSQKGSKGVTRSMSEHVMGWKPSMYLSFTTIAKGASNPKGDAFGDVIVKIDLMELKTRGIHFTYLGSKEGELLLAREITSKTGGVKQAFADITRTREVLIEGWVPPEALCSISNNGEIVWART